ncbi:DEKNAAC104614 [Brettanomyces naardenensis]|uniref:Guanine nucleotide-exchange factor SEC12 n=1 Tax=Brettanomyces naardenensis TaxID=13370 RepID=A0A448YR57_BRENA|nr:DEKNAAC104614 [Brettanomyces naardenensis]
MAKLKGYTLDVGYPVYGAKFVSNKTLIVAGGGGEGKNGVPNKITALAIHPDHPKKPLKRYRELVLNDQEDCPMSMDVNNNYILVGVNENSEMIKKGVNKHLRKFKFVNEHLKFVESCQIHPGSNPQHYEKITYLSKDGSLGCIAMSDNPSSVYIVDTSDDLEERFKIVTTGDVKDISISPDGKMMCYITSTHMEAISTITGRSVFKTDIKFHMTRVDFYDNNIVVLAGSDKSGIVVAHFSIAKSAIVKQAIVYKNLKGITSMDVNQANGLVSLSGSDCSILLVRFKDLKLLKKVNKVHNFAITKVTSSEDGHYLASVSAANTVSVLVVPSRFAESKSVFLSLFQILLFTILIGLLGVGSQYLYVNGYIDLAKQKLVQFYESRRPADSSSYFTIQPIGNSETFTKGSPSTTTYLPDDATIKSDIISHSSEDFTTSVTPFTEVVSTATPVTLAERKEETAEEISEYYTSAPATPSSSLSVLTSETPSRIVSSNLDVSSLSGIVSSSLEVPTTSSSIVISSLEFSSPPSSGVSSSFLESSSNEVLSHSTLKTIDVSVAKEETVNPIILTSVSPSIESSAGSTQITASETTSDTTPESSGESFHEPTSESSFGEPSETPLDRLSERSSPALSETELVTRSTQETIVELSSAVEEKLEGKIDSLEQDIVVPSEVIPELTEILAEVADKSTSSVVTLEPISVTEKYTVKETVIETSTVTSVSIATATEVSTVIERVTVTHVKAVESFSRVQQAAAETLVVSKSSSTPVASSVSSSESSNEVPPLGTKTSKSASVVKISSSSVLSPSSELPSTSDSTPAGASEIYTESSVKAEEGVESAEPPESKGSGETIQLEESVEPLEIEKLEEPAVDEEPAVEEKPAVDEEPLEIGKPEEPVVDEERRETEERESTDSGSEEPPVKPQANVQPAQPVESSSAPDA